MTTDELSLFSLELVVDKLFIPNSPCFFPSVSFRLLDFPMVTIHHVEKDLASRLKDKITKNSLNTIPTQLRELQDDTGTFVMKKGKSCLFKISLNSLRKQLHVTPLYLLIIDTFNNTPKLVANSTVPLNGLIERIHDDFIKNGIYVPSVHGDRGLYRVFNLMGSEIGYTVIGFRLLSLGPALTKHLSGQVFSQQHSAEELLDIADNRNVNDEILAVKKKKQLNTSTYSHSIDPVECLYKDTKNMSTNTITKSKWDNPDNDDDYDVKLANVCTQTEFDRNLRKSVKQKRTMKVCDSISPDGDHPPPLYFNNTGLKTVWMHKDPTYHNDFCDESSEVESITSQNSEFGVIRPKKYTETERQANYIDRDKQTVAMTKADDVEQSQSQRKNENESELVNNLQHLLKEKNSDSFYPILSALISEFASLTNNKKIQPSTIHTATGPYFTTVPAARSAEKVCSRCSNVDSKVSLRKQYSVESGSCYRRHQDCAIRDIGVPKNKSWIRTTPDQSVKKSKLVFGMTNSQRLRLEKGNPQWLKQVESAKNKQSRHNNILDEPVSIMSDISTEIQHNRSVEFIEVDNDSKQSKVTKINKKASVSKIPRAKSASAVCKGGRRNRLTVETVNVEPLVHNEKSPDFGTTLEQVVRALENIEDSDKQTETGQGDFRMLTENDEHNKSIDIHIPQVENLLQGDGERDDTETHSSQKQTDDSKKQTETVDIFDKADENRGFNLQPISAQASSIIHNTEDSMMFQSAEETELRDLVSDDDIDFDSDHNITKHQNDFNKINQPFNKFDDRTDSGKSKSSEGDKTSVVTALRVSIPNPMLSENSPVPSTRRSLAKADWSVTTKRDSDWSVTPRRDSLSSDSYQRPTPRPRLAKLRESINTESLSTYVPSDVNNVSVESEEDYSEDFHDDNDAGNEIKKDNADDVGDSVSVSSIDDDEMNELLSHNKYIPSTKLGYTIF